MTNPDIHLTNPDPDHDHDRQGANDMYEDMYEDRAMFADPGGNSALRAAGPGNPRDRDCPNCGAVNALTRDDEALGYQCNPCADRAEGWGP